MCNALQKYLKRADSNIFIKGGTLQKRELIGYSLFVYSVISLAPKDKVKFIREFFGHIQLHNGKTYSYGGLLNSINGIKISKNSFIVPVQNYPIAEAYLKSRGVDFVVKE